MAETTSPMSDAGIDASTEPKDPTERQKHMRRLVEEGQARVATTAKITKGVGDVAQFVLSAKAMIDLAIQNIPQAALPWAGVCIGLQVSNRTSSSPAEMLFQLTSIQILVNPAKATKSNLAGIKAAGRFAPRREFTTHA